VLRAFLVLQSNKSAHKLSTFMLVVVKHLPNKIFVSMRNKVGLQRC